MGVKNTTREQIVSHYRRHENIYQEIWEQLNTIHNRFQTASRDSKIAYLKLSYINSVISIQTAVFNQEEAVERLMRGKSLEVALGPVNYNGQKRKYISQSLNDTDVWNTLAVDLEEGAVDAAHRTALEQLNYIGPVKAPFILANLGYTEKMCLDTNVVQVMGMDDHPSTTQVEQYESLCRDVRDEFPVLNKELDPFHLHWVIFDWHRYADIDDGDIADEPSVPDQVTTHDAWFDAALSSPSTIREVVESLP